MIRTIIVGFGFMGQTHAINILKTQGMELCAIVDQTPAEKLLKTPGGNFNTGLLDAKTISRIPFFNDTARCLEKIKPDAAIICLPMFLHYAVTRLCLEHGCHVLLEKPFCPEVEQCRDLIVLAEEKKHSLMVAHCIRFAPQYEFLAQCIRDERYGKLRWLSTSRMGGEPAWGVWQNPEIKKTCGGSLFDLLIHDLDFVNYCFGAATEFKINVHRDEYWEVSLQYNYEAAISVKGGFLHRHTAFAAEYAATFERGSIRFSTLQPDIVHVGTDSGSQAVTVSGDGYCEELKYFAECIARRISPVRCLPESSMKAIELCHRIRDEA
ncbi:MAG: Gfo/Idh/MocA family protein [Victivallaceae bacterium]